MKEIGLTNGLTAIVDDEDYVRLSKHRWRRSVNTHTNYAVMANKRGKPRMHRVILGVDKCVGYEVDHINGNGLDNRKENLRICSKSSNQHNRLRLNSNNASGFIGVSLYIPNGKWRSRIQVNNSVVYLGYFNSPKEAFQARTEWLTAQEGV